MGVTSEEKLRAIRELMSVKAELKAQLTNSTGPVLPPRAARRSAPAFQRITLDEMLAAEPRSSSTSEAAPAESQDHSDLVLQLQRALREANAVSAARKSQLEAVEASVEAQHKRIADLSRALAEVGGGSGFKGSTPGTFQEVLALRDQVVELQTQLELERAARVKAESELRLLRSSSLGVGVASKSSAGANGMPSSLAAASDAAYIGKVVWCQSYSDLPPGGRWAMGSDGTIWYITPKSGYWKQSQRDGSFTLSLDAPVGVA
jgi:hypothetical protein